MFCSLRGDASNKKLLVGNKEVANCIVMVVIVIINVNSIYTLVHTKTPKHCSLNELLLRLLSPLSLYESPPLSLYIYLYLSVSLPPTA